MKLAELRSLFRNPLSVEVEDDDPFGPIVEESKIGFTEEQIQSEYRGFFLARKAVLSRVTGATAGANWSLSYVAYDRLEASTKELIRVAYVTFLDRDGDIYRFQERTRLVESDFSIKRAYYLDEHLQRRKKKRRRKAKSA